MKNLKIVFLSLVVYGFFTDASSAVSTKSLQVQPTTSDIATAALDIFQSSSVTQPLIGFFLQDINSDGTMDAILSTEGGEFIFPVLGSSTGPFKLDLNVQEVLTPDLMYFNMIDINFDGKNDIFALFEDKIGIFYNQNGSFSQNPNLSISVTDIPIHATPLDIDDNGTPEFIGVVTGDNIGSGNIEFYQLPNMNLIYTLPIAGNPRTIIDLPSNWIATPFPICLIMMDDGKTLYFDPTFGSPVDISDIAIPTTDLIDIDFFDLNNDGTMDHFTRHVSRTFNSATGFIEYEQKVKVFLNQGFPFTQVHEFTPPDNTFWIVPGDFDMNGMVDLVYSAYETPGFSYNLYASVNSSGTLSQPQDVDDQTAWKVFEGKYGAKIKPLRTGGCCPVLNADPKEESIQHFPHIINAINLAYTIGSLTVQNHPTDPNAQKLQELLNRLVTLVATPGGIVIRNLNTDPNSLTKVVAETDMNNGRIYLDVAWTDPAFLQTNFVIFISTLFHELIHSDWGFFTQNKKFPGEQTAATKMIPIIALFISDYGALSPEIEQALKDEQAGQIVAWMGKTIAFTELTNAYTYQKAHPDEPPVFDPQVESYKDVFHYSNITVVEKTFPQGPPKTWTLPFNVELEFTVHHSNGGQAKFKSGETYD